MKAILKYILSILLVSGFLTQSAAVVMNGGHGLPHVRAAWNYEKGNLTALLHTHLWGKVYEDKNEETGEIDRAWGIWDVQGLASFNYGLSKNVEFALTPILYQDLNAGEYDSYPWDMYFVTKLGSFAPVESPYQYGAEISFRLPTGDAYNAMFEDYSAGTIEWGINGLFSYSFDPAYREDAISLHANLGYTNHNDVNTYLVGKEKTGSYVTKQSQDFYYGIGVLLPTLDFVYGLELYGHAWMQQPPLAAASRENYTYLAASISYKPNLWFELIVSGDLRISNNDDTTIPSSGMSADSRWDKQISNYNPWKINLTGKFAILPLSIFKQTEREVILQKAEEGKELYEQLRRERTEAQSAQNELDRIEQEREKTQQEIDRLKKMLEGEHPDNEQE